MSDRKIDLSKLSDFELSMLIIKRNVRQYEVEQIDEFLNKIGEAKGFSDAGKQTSASAEAKGEPAAVQEITFTTLKFEPQKGTQLGDYEIAFKNGNIDDKFRYAYNILRKSNATIKSRYRGQGYQYSYWLYGADKIYRQNLKPKLQS